MDQERIRQVSDFSWLGQQQFECFIQCLTLLVVLQGRHPVSRVSTKVALSEQVAHSLCWRLV